MRFRYIDVKMMRVVAVFENSHGSTFVWTANRVKKNQKKFKEMGDWDAAIECQEALDMMKEFRDSNKPWWKFW